MKSSPRPHGVLVCYGVRTVFYRVPAAFWVAFHGVCTAISVRLRDAFGVCTAFSWRSGTALTACRQSRYDVSIICLFALSAVPAYTCTQIENQLVV